MTDTAGSRAAADVAALLRARNPLIWVVTREEARAERQLMAAAAAARYEPLFWDCANGLSDLAGEPSGPGERLADPVAALDALRDSRDRQVWIFRDLPAWFRDPLTVRKARSLARKLPSFPRDQARAMIIITPSAEVPPELSGDAIVVDWPLPDRTELGDLLDLALRALPDDVQFTNGTRDAAIDAAVGLTAEEARSCYARSLVSTGAIDPVLVATEKRRVIARERVLEWFDPLPGGLDAVGGLDLLKDWLVTRRSAFSQRARDYGLPAPKGCLLVGISGCGKSLTAKAVATAWSMPLLRLDLGALKSKWVGESEGNIRKALKVAETVAPCVLWVDEVEKALAGATQGAADGGVSTDALGAVLNWMQERAGSVFVVATANDVSAMPPELLRKGRFDELFFVDLPTDVERSAILAAALTQYGRDASLLGELAALTNATEGFTGAEIASLVPDALFTAFGDGEREITAADLMTAAQRVTPLSQTAEEKITALRAWAKGRTRPASSKEESRRSSITETRDLDLDDDVPVRERQRRSAVARGVAELSEGA